MMPDTPSATRIFSQAFEYIQRQWKAALLIVFFTYCAEIALGIAISPIPRRR